jgi:protein-S-isoprenylcysteine O-methyltransferase Ste14
VRKGEIESDVIEMATSGVRMGFVGAFILLEWLVVVGLGYVVTVAFHLPKELGFGSVVRTIGALMIVSSALVLSWLERYRRPVDVLTSTYVTFLKLAKRAPLQERVGRSEPLVVKGPYRYVRHPLYLGVSLFACGLWLILDWTPLLVTTVLFVLWFNFVLTPFEEKELVAMFGTAYEEYRRKVPKLIPIPRNRRVE